MKLAAVTSAQVAVTEAIGVENVLGQRSNLASYARCRRLMLMDVPCFDGTRLLTVLCGAHAILGQVLWAAETPGTRMHRTTR